MVLKRVLWNDASFFSLMIHFCKLKVEKHKEPFKHYIKVYQ